MTKKRRIIFFEPDFSSDQYLHGINLSLELMMVKWPYSFPLPREDEVTGSGSQLLKTGLEFKLLHAPIP